MRVTLQRLETSDEGTFGWLAVNGETFATGELPWRKNAESKSCIPAGIYPCSLAPSLRFKTDLYHVWDVPKRSGILFHPANFMGDKSKGLKCELEGCISIGMRRGLLGTQKAVLESRAAVEQFMKALDGQPFELEVLDPQEGA